MFYSNINNVRIFIKKNHIFMDIIWEMAPRQKFVLLIKYHKKYTLDIS